LRDGSLIEGVYMGGTQNTVRFETDEGVSTYPVADVLAVTFESVIIDPPETKEASEEEEGAEGAREEVEPAMEPSMSATVPPGTRIIVRTRETLDSRRHRAGHMFTASLEGDLVADGKTLAPHGSTVYGRLSEARGSGRMVGKSSLTLEITDIMIDNRPHSVTTGSLKAVTEDTAARTVGTTARTAAIGGLIKGSKGAKTGAKVGVGLSIVTSGNQIYIPGGTLLEFTLSAPFTVTP
jgi:hypothetical protein